MWKGFRIIVILSGIFLLTACPANAQEGAFHAAFRHLVAIPYALLGGVLGPGCRPVGTTGDFDCRGQGTCNPGVTVLPGSDPYRAVAPSVAVEPRQPAYITYTLIYQKPEKEKENTLPTVVYDSPLPFPELDR